MELEICGINFIFFHYLDLTNFSFLLQRFANFLISQNWKKKKKTPWSIAPINNLFVALLTRERERERKKR
jgi:hypothetical protein